MIETPVIVGHEDGIEGRPIALLVQGQASTPAKSTFRWTTKRSMQKVLWE